MRLLDDLPLWKSYMVDKKQSVLALYPNRYGVAYALFGSPTELIEYGIGNIQPVSNRISLKKIKQYIYYYKPDIIITRNLNDLKNRKSKRIAKLIDAICREAREQKLGVHTYTRTEIKSVFEQFKALSKYQISQKIIEWFAELKAYEFPLRKRWMAENYNAGVFDAVSLAVVYWYLEQ